MFLKLFSFFVLSFAHADTTHVIYFAGFAATQANVDCWKSGATKPGFDFQTVAWPKGAKSDYQSAVKAGAQTVNTLLKQIESSKDNYVIAGHSSGAALADDLASKVSPKNYARIRVVDLDGFLLGRDLQKKIKTECVYATNGNLKSRNADAMKSGCLVKAIQVPNTTCKTAWCLHFSTVNKSVPASLGAYPDFVKRGYQGCKSNLDWL